MYYQIGDVFVSASQSETQGLTYIEALASGLPVVAKADKCLIGVLEDNVNGYAFNTEDDFIGYLDSILYNELKQESLAFGAIRSIRKFSAKYFVSTVEELYKNMLLNQTESQKVSV